MHLFTKLNRPLRAVIQLVLVRQAALVDRDRDAVQLVVVDEHLTLFRKSEGPFKQQILIENHFPIMADGGLQMVAITEAGLFKDSQGNVGP